MTKFCGDIPTRESDTTRACCAWCLKQCKRRCTCGVHYCSDDCQKAACELGRHTYACKAAARNLDIMNIGILEHEIVLRHWPWEFGICRVAMYRDRHWVLSSMLSAGVGRYDDDCDRVSRAHPAQSPAFAIKDVAARQLATEESAKRGLSLIHASNVEFEKKQRRSLSSSCASTARRASPSLG